MKSDIDEWMHDQIMNEIFALNKLKHEHPNIINLRDHGLSLYTNSRGLTR